MVVCRFEDIIRLDEAKRLLSEAVQLPIRFPSLFTGILRPWKVESPSLTIFISVTELWCGREFCCTARLALAKRCSPELWRRNVTQHFSIYQVCRPSPCYYFICGAVSLLGLMQRPVHSASTLVSKWRGDSEKLVRCLFEVSPCPSSHISFIPVSLWYSDI